MSIKLNIREKRVATTINEPPHSGDRINRALVDLLKYHTEYEEYIKRKNTHEIEKKHVEVLITIDHNNYAIVLVDPLVYKMFRGTESPLGTIFDNCKSHDHNDIKTARTFHHNQHVSHIDVKDNRLCAVYMSVDIYRKLMEYPSQINDETVNKTMYNPGVIPTVICREGLNTEDEAGVPMYDTPEGVSIHNTPEGIAVYMNRLAPGDPTRYDKRGDLVILIPEYYAKIQKVTSTERKYFSFIPKNNVG